MTGGDKTGTMGRAAWLLLLALLCSACGLGSRPAWQRAGVAFRPGARMRARTRPRPASNQPASSANPRRPHGAQCSRPGYGLPGALGSHARPSVPVIRRQRYPGPAYPGPCLYPASQLSRPIHGYAPPTYAPPGHLGDWLNQHRSLPVQEQEQMLRSDPSFNRLSPCDQQRVVQQLHQVNQMPDEQRQRRLARAEALEHMSPQERMQVNNSARRWANQPPERQALMKSAFRDLRSVPLDQRQTVLNSAATRASSAPRSATSSPTCSAPSPTSRRANAFPLPRSPLGHPAHPPLTFNE